MKRRASAYGFTLVELLVAAAIMALILSALGGLFVSTSRAYRANDEVSERQQSADAAAQLLSYEVGLAGYRGSTKSDVETREFKGSTLTITKGASDKLIVRHFEDRYVESEEFIITFEVAKDRDGFFNLYHRQQEQDKIEANQDSSSKQPAIQHVQNLKVLKYIDKRGDEVPSIAPEDLAALKLELTFTDGLKKQVVVGINNPQNDPNLPNLNP